MTDTQRAAFEARYTEGVSAEPLEIIRANECDDGFNTLTRSRFRRLWNELQAAQAADAGKSVHASDCAVHNEPAYLNGPCDCGLVAAINAELVEALEACLAKGSRWHTCDPVVQQARAALTLAKEQM